MHYAFLRGRQKYGKMEAEYPQKLPYWKGIIDYAGNEYFIRNGNPSLAITPYQMMLRALHEIRFKEEYKKCV